MPKVLALIPARSGSKGVPHKNIRSLGGRPLIEWSIAACKAAASIDATVVSTDCERYREIAQNCGAEVPFLRPTEISSDMSSDYSFIKHALDWFYKNSGEPDYLVHIRPTTPFRDPDIIDSAVETFTGKGSWTALRSVQEMSESAYKTFEIDNGEVLKSVGFSNSGLDFANDARQQFPTTYTANGYVDVLSTAFIRENKIIHGEHVKAFISPKVTEVDDEDDFKNLEVQLKLNPKLYDKIFKMRKI